MGSVKLAKVAQGGAEGLAQSNECFLGQIQLFALPMKDTPMTFIVLMSDHARI
jgi:hypothetical protein